MPTTAVRVIRQMRGRTQAHLVEAADGHHYVVKFTNNPHRRRLAINEWLGSTLLTALAISCPTPQLVYVPTPLSAVEEDNPVKASNRLVSVPTGWHYGSRFPGNPAKRNVYDFIPDQLLCRVVNGSDFIGAFVFDTWTSNSDMRQSIFVRTPVDSYSHKYEGLPKQDGFVALMVDHGEIFSGSQWSFAEARRADRCWRNSVYRWIRHAADIDPWLHRVHEIRENVITDAVRQLPTEWIANDSSELASLLGTLMNRREKLHKLVLDCL